MLLIYDVVDVVVAVDADLDVDGVDVDSADVDIVYIFLILKLRSFRKCSSRLHRSPPKKNGAFLRRFLLGATGLLSSWACIVRDIVLSSGVPKVRFQWDSDSSNYGDNSNPIHLYMIYI